MPCFAETHPTTSNGYSSMYALEVTLGSNSLSTPFLFIAYLSYFWLWPSRDCFAEWLQNCGDDLYPLRISVSRFALGPNRQPCRPVTFHEPTYRPHMVKALSETGDHHVFHQLEPQGGPKLTCQYQKTTQRLGTLSPPFILPPRAFHLGRYRHARLPNALPCTDIISPTAMTVDISRTAECQ